MSKKRNYTSLSQLDSETLENVLNELNELDEYEGYEFSDFAIAYNGDFETVEDFIRFSYGWEDKELDEEDQKELNKNIEYFHKQYQYGPGLEYVYDPKIGRHHFFTFE